MTPFAGIAPVRPRVTAHQDLPCCWDVRSAAPRDAFLMLGTPQDGSAVDNQLQQAYSRECWRQRHLLNVKGELVGVPMPLAPAPTHAHL